MNLEENRRQSVQFLVQAARLLPTENHAQKLLKSYYLTKCKKLAGPDLDQANSLLSEEEVCRKCSTPWADVNFSLSIAPIKTTKRKARKLHTLIEDKSKRKNHLAKKLSKRANNVVTVRCDLCKNKNKVTLWKKPAIDPKKTETTKSEQKIVAVKRLMEPEVPQQQPSKKKRKKDKTAGLLYSITKVESDASKKIVNLCQKTKTLNIQRPIQPVMNKSLSQPSKKKGNAQKGQKAKSKNAATIKPPKLNSLIHLANALKAQTNQSPSNSHADKLKKLLR